MIARIARAALASLVLASAALPAGAQTLETVKVASPPVDVAGNLFYALDLGYFTKAGIDVQISQLSAGSRPSRWCSAVRSTWVRRICCRSRPRI
jgi:ABC-type nitrate/sulfonate/bicarbonate transport system substrate-binding protein